MDFILVFQVAFLIFPTKTNSFNVESLRGHAVTKGLKDTIDEIQKDIGKRMYEICLRGRIPDSEDLLSKNDIVKLKRCVYAQGSTALPPITTHNIAVRFALTVLSFHQKRYPICTGLVLLHNLRKSHFYTIFGTMLE